jgi:putative hydrolase of the HAD superfamily
LSSPGELHSQPLPRAILFDLDDTLVVFDAVCGPAWHEVCGRWAGPAGLAADALHRAIQRVSRAYWSDPERHRTGRLALEETRAAIVAEALREIGVADPAVAPGIAADYCALQESRIAPFPDAFPTLEALQRAGVRMALVTNGNAVLQRRKIARFGLERYMAAFLVEGELGFGKPDRRVFELALRALEVSPDQAWCVGDNLEWDVAGAQAAGIAGIWKDNHRRGLPDGNIRPDRIIFELSDLVASPAGRG